MKNKLLTHLGKLMRFSMVQLVIITLCHPGLAKNAIGQKIESVFDVVLILSVQDKPVLDVFSLIEEKTVFKFAYDKGLLDANQRVSLSVGTVGEALTDISNQLHVEFKQINHVIAVSKRPEKKAAAAIQVMISERTLQGRVVDRESAQPLVGATVQVTGTTLGTITDAEGAFSISVPDDAVTLLVSYIGYLATEIPIGGQTFLEIPLAIDTQSLEEIIVVGYGEQSKSNYTGSISSVPEERLTRVPNLNVAQSIQGAIPGVTVIQSSAGAASTESIIIRGRNSILANNSPLIVVDRVPYNGQLRDINVNDIQSIEVLKDASATAIYGSRGSNGVILITTKEGTSGKATITYDGRYSIQRFDRLPNYMSGPEFLSFKEIREPGNLTATEQENIDAGRWTDWQDIAVRDGYSQQHNMSVTGGTDKIRYYYGASFLDVQGVTLNDNYTRVIGRVNLDVQITDWLSIGTRTQYTDDDRSGVGLSLSEVGRANPLTNAYDANGRLTLYPWPEFTDIANPLEPINYQNTDVSRQILSNNYLLVDFPFLQGLSYRLNTGITERFTDINTYKGRNTKAGLEAGGIADTERGQYTTAVIENILDYSRTFSGRHSIGLTGVYSYQNDKFTSNLLHAESFPNDITSFYNAAQAQVVIPEYRFVRTDLISSMIRLNYGLDEKYLLTLTARRDGYSGFGDNDKWGDFATIAGAWVVSRESFFPWEEAIDFLKLRVSYGENGNQAVDPYQSTAKFGIENFVNGAVSLPGVIPDNLANPELSWETSRSFNLGLDFGLVDNKITGSIDYFNTNTSDLLLNRTISPVHGISSITDNIGETKNSGLEIALNSSLMIGRDVTWNANVNFTFIENKIVSLGLGENGELDDVASGLFIGEPITSNFNFLFDGVWQESEADEAASFGTQPGYIKIRDVNRDGQTTAADRTIIGQRDPRQLWGMTHTFGYKNFSLSLFVHGVHGVTKENQLFQDASASSGVRRNVILKNWWTPENPTNDFFSNHINAGAQQGFSAPLYQDAGFVRIKDITLAYSFPAGIFEKIGLSRINLYCTGRNLFTITDWKESDPELDAGRGTIPLQKEYVFGITLIN